MCFFVLLCVLRVLHLFHHQNITIHAAIYTSNVSFIIHIQTDNT
jgi:hypothetical protein